MKSLAHYIQEKLIIKKNKSTNYKYFPQTKEELKEMIEKRIKDEGNEVDLNDIDVSKITDEMLIGEPFKYDYKNTPDKVAANLIHFKDGYAVSLKPYDLKSGNNINPERPRKKPSRYGTGIGDTGDHNKEESPFFKNGKKDVGPEYNGFGVSSRAGESQHYREAIKNNKNDIKYYEEHPDGEYSKNAINKAKKNIQTIKGYGKE